MKTLFNYPACMAVFASCVLFIACKTDNKPNGGTGVDAKVYSYKNLAIYPIEGKNNIGRTYVTLEQAMENQSVVLHETGSVGELAIDNNSDEYVFVMAGDIVKGGQQDRTIGEDVVLPPRTKDIPLQSFCVEQSRWSQRQAEAVNEFSSTKKSLSSKSLKVAARANKNQSEVWEEVSKYQEKTSENVQADLKSEVSQTSLQLTLESDELKSKVDEYLKALDKVFEDNENVVGFAFSINGKISTVEWFGNADLFAKLRRKLLESAINEAIYHDNGKTEYTHPTPAEVDVFIKDARSDIAKQDKGVILTNEVQYKTDKSYCFEFFDTTLKDISFPLHVSVYSSDDLPTAKYQMVTR